MKITNRFGVPETLVALASKEYYSKGRADFSVTELISPPRIQRLRRRHWEEMSEDVSDRLWQLLGSALHVVAERGQADGHLTEERLYAEVDGVTISGAIDLQKQTDDGVVITDYKFTSAWALRQDKPDWEAQQNIYAWLVQTVKKQPVAGVQICALVRDWSRREASQKPDYPQAPIQVLQLPLWSLERSETYIRERLDAHRHAKVKDDWGDELPNCTDSERWLRDAAFAVKKKGYKRAIRILASREEAEELAQKEGGFVEERPGEAVRCINNFCGVAQWCSQFNKEAA